MLVGTSDGECDGIIGGRIKGRDSSKRFLPRRVKLRFEGIDGRGGYIRSGEPVPIFYDSY